MGFIKGSDDITRGKSSYRDRSNKFKLSYSELKSKMEESPNTIKNWRDHLVKNQVVKVIKGSYSMTFVMLSPYDSLVTCRKDDWNVIRVKSDPKVKRVLDKLSCKDNMSLLPLVVELTTKINKIEKKGNVK